MDVDNKTILIAEDNPVTADVIRFNLERAGFKVTVAVNGRQAADLLKTNRFALIITDYQMPEMTGEEFCRQVRQDPHHVDVPILLCSAKGFELDVDRLKQELGISIVLLSPFSPREIVGIAQSTLDDQAIIT